MIVKLLRLLCVALSFLVIAFPASLTGQGKSASQVKKSTAKKKTSGGASSRGASSTAKKSTSSAKGTKRAASSKKKSRSRASARGPQSQRSPEPERIREIQQALNEHGYPLEVSGNWDSASVEALKRFQTDKNIKNLTGAGKLDSRTLMALGLGPQHDSSSEPAKPASEGPVQQ